MDLNRLKHAVLLADEASFARAADRACLSQSAFSRSIQTLEDELGFVLFERNSRNVAVSAVGAGFLERARRLIAQAQDLERDVVLMKDGKMGAVRLAANPFASHTLVARLIEAIWRKHPSVQVIVDQHDPEQLMELLLRNAIEFCITDTTALAGREGLLVESLSSVALGFVCRPGHPLVKRKKLLPTDLCAFGISCGTVDDSFKAALFHWFGLAPGERLPITFTGNNAFAHWQLTRRTDVVALAALPAFARELRAGRLVQLPLQLPAALVGDVGIVRMATRQLSPPAALMIDTLRGLVKSNNDFS